MAVPPNYSSYHHSKYPTPTANANQHRYTPPAPHDAANAASPPHIHNANASASPPSVALSRLRLHSISHPQQQCQASIYVPSHAVGAVIGRGGRTVLNVQREAMRKSLGHGGAVRISVLGGNAAANGGNEDGRDEIFSPGAATTTTTTTTTNNPPSPWNYHEYFHSVQKDMIHDDDDGHDDRDAEAHEKEDDEDSYTPVVVRGDPVGCFAAVRQIPPLVDHAHDPHIVFEVPIHRSKHALLLGSRGAVLASLSAAFRVRIMIPPNGHDATTAAENRARRRGADAGATALFPDADAVRPRGAASPSSTRAIAIKAPPATTPPHVLQLEGEIDDVERCLVRMLAIVAGEPYFPAGAIVPLPVVETGTTHPDEDHTKAVAIVTAAAGSGISQSKFRSVQRKTNTLVRRKRGRFVFRGVEYGRKTVGNDSIREDEEGSAVNEEEDDDDVEEEEEDDDEKDDVEEEEEEEEEEEALAATGGKTPVSFVISGKVENVKAAVQQFERLLGSEANSSVVMLRDVPLKTNGETNTSTKCNDGGGASVENDKKKRNQRNKARRKTMKSQKDGAAVGNRFDAESG